MPYNETESLKDQVGVLVGLFASEESITKLAQVQLVQMGPKIIPYLASVLEDMSRKHHKMGEDIKKLEEKDRKRNEEKNEYDSYYEYRPSREFDREKWDLQKHSSYNEEIVIGTLEVLTYFPEESLIDIISEWTPFYAVTKILIRMGTEKAFEVALPSIYEIYKLGAEEDIEFGHDVDYEVRNKISYFLSELGMRDNVSEEEYSYSDRYLNIKSKIVEETVSYVPAEILKDLISEFPKLELHQREFVKDVIKKIGYERFGEKIVEWFTKGDFDTRLLLADEFMDCKELVDKDLALKVFSMELDGMELDKDPAWLTAEVPEKVDEFLVNATDTKGKIDMYFKIISAKEKYINEHGSDSMFRHKGSYREPETWDDLSIVNHILLKLQENREEVIKILSKYLTNNDKKLVRWSTQLLGKLTEEAD